MLPVPNSHVKYGKSVSSGKKPEGLFNAIITRVVSEKPLHVRFGAVLGASTPMVQYGLGGIVGSFLETGAKAKVYARIPRMAGEFEFGPVDYIGAVPSVGDRVFAGFKEGRQDELVLLTGAINTTGTGLSLGTVVNITGDMALSAPIYGGGLAEAFDIAGLAMTGDIYIKAKVSPNIIQGNLSRCIVSIFDLPSFVSLLIENDGRLIYTYKEGAGSDNFIWSSAAMPFAANDVFWVAINHDVNDGAGNSEVFFYTSTDGETWTQLGTSTPVAPNVSVFNGSTSADIYIGRRVGDAFPAWYGGDILEVEVRSGGEAGTTVVDVKFSDEQGWSVGQLQGDVNVDALGNEFTLRGTAEIVAREDSRVVSALLEDPPETHPITWGLFEPPAISRQILVTDLGNEWVATTLIGEKTVKDSPRNVIWNPDFEEGTAPHFIFDDGPGAVWEVVEDLRNARTGKRVLRVDTSGMPGAGPTGQTRFMLQGLEHLPEPHFKTTTGDVWLFSMWVKAGGEGLPNRVRTRSEQWHHTIGHLGGAGTSDWVVPTEHYQRVGHYTVDPLNPLCEWIVFDIEVEDTGNPQPIIYFDSVDVRAVETAVNRGTRFGGIVTDDPFVKADYTGLKGIRIGSLFTAVGDLDASQALSDVHAIQPWTPVLTATTANPNLGSTGTSVGRYVKLPGGIVHARFRITFSGTGISGGTGAWFISYPVPPANHAQDNQIGLLRVAVDPTQGWGFLEYQDTSTAQPIFYLSTAAGTPISATGLSSTNCTPAGSNYLDGMMIYEAAPDVELHY